jgi:hypothetical protein
VYVVSKELDRICLVRLLEFSRNMSIQRAAQSPIGDGRVPDISQKGTGNSSFRNEMFNGAPISVDDKFASQSLPTTGHLCFDYCSTDRPAPQATIASDVRVVKCLVDCFLISRRLLDRGLKKLKVLKELSDQTIKGDGNNLLEIDYDSAKIICEYQAMFYEHLAERNDLIVAAAEQEVISVNYEQEVMKKYNIKAPFRHASSFDRSGKDNSPGAIDYSLLGSPSPKKVIVVSAASVTTAAGKSSKSVTVPDLGPLDHNRRNSVAVSARSTDPNRSTKLKLSASSVKETAAAHISTNVDQDLIDYKQQANTSSKIFRTMSNAVFASGKTKESASLSRKAIQDNPFLALYEDVVDDIVGDTDISNDNGRFPGSILLGGDGKVIDELVDAHGYPIRLKAPVTRSSSIGGTDLKSMANVPDMGRHKSFSNLLQYNSGANARKDVVEFQAKFSAMILSQEVSRRAKALRMVELIEDVFSPLYLYARHVALIMEMFFELGSMKRTEYFGTYRVDACVTLFDRIVDLHNIDLVLRVLTLYEIACLYCRIGWLSIFNPLKPEGSYALDLSRHEERMVCKILVRTTATFHCVTMFCFIFRFCPAVCFKDQRAR